LKDLKKNLAFNFVAKIKTACHPIPSVWQAFKKMSTQKNSFFDYNTKYLQDLKNYQEELKNWEQIKDKIGEEGFCIIKRVFHPIYEYRENKKWLEKELPFYDWLLKKENIEKYNLTKEKQDLFLQRRRKIMAELEAISRLLKFISRKWSFKI
jgi:hypothetical protein